MDNKLINMFKISPKQRKVFLGTFIAMFVIVSLQLLGVRAPKIALPVPQNPDIFFDSIRPKLEQIENKYQLRKKQQIIPSVGAAGEYENASAYAVIDYDNGEVIASKNLTQRLPIASLTKIMTAVVALDLAKPTDRFTYTQRASLVVPTKIGGNIGESMSVNELLHASLMTSANDAVEVIRNGINTKYKGDYFVRAMNEKAESLGLKDTSFTNPQGFDNEKHFSTVADLAVLSHYALTNYPLIAEISKKDYIRYPADSYHKQIDLFNWNGLINVYPQTIGIKIGNTGRAGYTTAVVSERNGKKIMAIVLGAPGILQRDLWAAQLLDLGYERVKGLTSVAITEEQLRAKYNTWSYWN